MKLIAKRFEELTNRELYEILKSRTEIFLLEQDIKCQDMDDTDYDSLHCFFLEDGRVIAYLRAFHQDDDRTIVKIGRVLTLEHGRGIGTELMEQSLRVIKERMDCRKVSMNAQKQAVRFYERLGFEVTSGDFLEEGVVHNVMEMEF